MEKFFYSEFFVQKIYINIQQHRRSLHCYFLINLLCPSIKPKDGFHDIQLNCLVGPMLSKLSIRWSTTIVFCCVLPTYLLTMESAIGHFIQR